jgi:two-component system sensor histidine kinase DegS
VLTGEVTEPAQHALSQLEHTIRQAIQETRAAMVDLRPIALDEIGLHAALQQYAEQFQHRTGIRCQVVKLGSRSRLPSMVESCFYRIAQEALTNVWKHADAQLACVSLVVEERFCSLEISDDGKGINPDALGEDEGEHLGLSSLRDRAELVGGQLYVGGMPEGGTRVRVDAPLLV